MDPRAGTDLHNTNLPLFASESQLLVWMTMRTGTYDRGMMMQEGWQGKGGWWPISLGWEASRGQRAVNDDVAYVPLTWVNFWSEANS